MRYSNKLLLDIDDDPKDVVLMSLDKIDTLPRRIYYRMYANTVGRVTKYAMKRVFKAFYSSPGKTYPNALFLPNISFISEPTPTVNLLQLSNKILVVGWFRYFPNIEGLKHFIIHVFPLIRKMVSGAELEVVGKMDDNDLRTLCEITEGVNPRGFVEDLKLVYSGCKCVVVPIYKGTGTSVKLVEAFAYGKAVVTTSVGKRGLHPAFQEGVDYLLARSDEEFAQHVVKLLTDVDTNEKMRNRATTKYQVFYSEEAFDDILRNVVFTK